jgi:1-acyl-sn-glycerol-3-phosphate acyltransferase
MRRRYEEIGNPIDEVAYGATHFTVNSLAKALALYRAEGVDNLPSEGRGMLACHHLHGSDILFVPGAIKRHLTVIGRRGIMEIPVLGDLFERWGAKTIDRPGDDEDISIREAAGRAVTVMREALEDDRLVLAFSNGTREPGVAPGWPKAGLIKAAVEANAPIYPAVLKGSDRLSDQRVTLRVGLELGNSPTVLETRIRLMLAQQSMFDDISHSSEHYQTADNIPRAIQSRLSGL